MSDGPTRQRQAHTDTLERRQLLAAVRALRRGEFQVRLPDDRAGIDGQICEAFNELVQFAGGLSEEITELRQRIRRIQGLEAD